MGEAKQSRVLSWLENHISCISERLWEKKRRKAGREIQPRRSERHESRCAFTKLFRAFCPPGFLSIGMYDRQPNWSHSDDRRVPSVSFANPLDRFAFNFSRGKRRPLMNSVLHAASILSAAFLAAVTRPIALSIKAKKYFGLITATR